MLASQPHAKAHAEEGRDEHQVGEIRGDADLRAEPADQRQLEDQDREGGEGQLDGGRAAAGEGSDFYVAAFAVAENDDSRSMVQICSLYSV